MSPDESKPFQSQPLADLSTGNPLAKEIATSPPVVAPTGSVLSPAHPPCEGMEAKRTALFAELRPDGDFGREASPSPARLPA